VPGLSTHHKLESEAMNDNRPFTMRCASCSTRNKIPVDKLGQRARCGKCKTTLDTGLLLDSRSIMVTDANFNETVNHSPLPVLLFSWAPWCPTCTTVAPIMDEFAKDARSRIRVGKLNVDANPVLSSKYDIRSVPFLFIFDGGQLKESLPGGLQKHELMMKMAHYL
jgi:thioredoxin 2